MYYRLIAPKWKPMPPIEGEFTHAEITKYNAQGYNIYYLPNTPGPEHGNPVSGSDILNFTSVFVDCDLKDARYISKDAFIERIAGQGIQPSKIVDSGHGVMLIGT